MSYVVFSDLWDPTSWSSDMDSAYIDNVSLKVIKEIANERQAQDAQWGGAGTDDSWLVGNWYDFIHYQMRRSNDDCRDYARSRVREGEFRDPTPEEFLAMDTICRARFVKIAALAVAAIESIDRRETAFQGVDDATQS